MVWIIDPGSGMILKNKARTSSDVAVGSAAAPGTNEEDVETKWVPIIDEKSKY